MLWPPERVLQSLPIAAHSECFIDITDNSYHMVLFLNWNSFGSLGFNPGVSGASIKVKGNREHREEELRGLEDDAKVRWSCSSVCV